jgi:hypothetical protein
MQKGSGMKLTSPYLRNVIRTFAPALIGGVASWITSKTTKVDPTILAVTGVSATTLYYAIVRYVETKVPALGLLLGAKKEATPNVPTVSATATAQVSAGTTPSEPTAGTPTA